MTSPSKMGNILRQIEKFTGGITPKAWLYKFVPLVIIQACAVFAYTILKNSKNSVVARVSPPETFSWLKILVIAPFALLFPLLLKKIIDVLKDKKSKIPYALMGIFFVIYLVFGFVVFPLSNVLQFPWLIDLIGKIPVVPSAILNGIGNTVGYWANSLFYGCSELWAVVGINFLAWGIANDICSKDEVKIFYPAFGLLVNVGGWIAAKIVGKINISSLSGAAFDGGIRKIVSLVCAAIALMALTYMFIEQFVIKDPSLMPPKKEPKKKEKPANGLQLVLGNPYLQRIAMIVLAYGMIIFFSEQCWYDSIIRAYGKETYTAVTAKASEINSLMTIILSVLSATILSNLPWAVRAMLPVVMVGFSAVGFLTFFMLGKSPEAVRWLASSGLLSVVPLQFAVVLGSFQNIASRCTKYSINDSTREQLFNSSHDEDVKLQGKGAVDVAVGRVAKSGGSVILMVLLSAHSLYLGFRGSIFGNKGQKDQMEYVQDSSAVESDAQSSVREAAKELGRKLVQFEQKDGLYRITLTDPAEVESQEFDKIIDSEGKTVFVQKAAAKAPVVTKSESAKVTKSSGKEKAKSTISDVVPAIFVIVLIMAAIWTYAVVTIAPMHEANLAGDGEEVEMSTESENKDEAESDKDDEKSKSKKSDKSEKTNAKHAKKHSVENPFNLKNIGLLIGISVLASGGLYVWVSKEINVVVANVQAKMKNTSAVK